MKHCLECLIYLLIQNKKKGVNGEIGIQTYFTVIVTAGLSVSQRGLPV